MATFWRLVSALTILGQNSGSRAWQQTTLLVGLLTGPGIWFDAKKLEVYLHPRVTPLVSTGTCTHLYIPANRHKILKIKILTALHG